MKKISYIILGLAMLNNTIVKSQKVSLNEAVEVAKITTKNNTQKGSYLDKNNIIAFTDKQRKSFIDTLLYICKLPKKGFIIISADKSIPPVLGYCKNGVFNLDSLPPGLIYLLNRYKYETKQIRLSKFTNELTKKDWDLYTKKGIQPKDIKTRSTTPMLSTEWGQKSGYNKFTPNNNPAGCTSVAMAQILRYWACRVVPKGQSDGIDFGNTTYEWAKMHNKSDDIYNAQLIYHAGVSCNTDYGSDGSSSTPSKARNGFVDYWGIDSDADVKWRIWHLRKWKGMLKKELNKGRPLLYSGGGFNPKSKSVEASGHSWVIDGYLGDKFHCNWGWYGNYNDYYSLGDFNPYGDVTYNQMESAIFYVEPKNESSTLQKPLLTNKTFKYSSSGCYTITVPPVANATNYYWSTENGTITGNMNTAQLCTNKPTKIVVTAYNSHCGSYSPTAEAFIQIGLISGASILCDKATYKIENLPSGASVTWSVSNDNLLLMSGQGTKNALFQKINNGLSIIRANIIIGNTSFNIKKTIECGSQPQSFGLYDTEKYYQVGSGCINRSYYLSPYYPYPSHDGGDYQWTISGAGIEEHDFGMFYLGKKLDFIATEEGYYTFTLRYSGACGDWSEPYTKSFYFRYCEYDNDEYLNFNISPNPVQDNILVSIKTENRSSSINTPYEIEIWNNQYLVKTLKSQERNLEINVSDLPNGFYYIIIKNGGKVSRQTFVKE